MSGLAARADDTVNGVDVREQGNSLRVASNTPHLVSLGTGRLSTAVTLHPIKQGRVTIGSDPTCDIYVAGTGVCNVHCRVENSHGVVTLYPINGSTLLDGMLVDKPTRLSQGSMLTIGRSNYLRFNHPEEAKLMKSVLPTAHISMAPIQFQPNEECSMPEYTKQSPDQSANQCYDTRVYQKTYKDHLSPLEHELEMTIKELSKRKPPLAPKIPYRDLEFCDSDQESQKSKMSGIMAKVSKFEYYARSQQKTIGRSQFYTNHTDAAHEISPKVFSSNSLTVNTPAKDVFGKNVPTNYVQRINNENRAKIVSVNENNLTKNCSYANVAIRNKTKIDDIVKNFDDTTRYDGLPKKVNNDEQNNHIYGKINNDFSSKLRNVEHAKYENDVNKARNVQNDSLYSENKSNIVGFGVKGVSPISPHMPSTTFDRNPQYSPVYGNSSQFDRNVDSESKRFQAYQERVKEEAVKDAENARLDEILSMCAEYEKQISSGMPITPTEKRSQNKIITNGSLPRSVVMNNPNFVQTSEGYYKFDTRHPRSNGMSQSLPVQRNHSTYENYDITQMSYVETQRTPEITINDKQNHENLSRMDELGIPVFEESNSPKNFPITELSSPLMVRKVRNQNGELPKIPLHMPATSPIGSPYENLYHNRNLKPKSPNTQSPRSRIKTSFAHKNLPSPQYFIFPTPPPQSHNNAPNFDILPNSNQEPNQTKSQEVKVDVPIQRIPPKVPAKPDFLKKVQEKDKPIVQSEKVDENTEAQFTGIEKQLSLEEEIPMIDDEITNDLEFRYSVALQEPQPTEDKAEMPQPIEVNVEIKTEPISPIAKNKSFDDVKNELMADIPELEEFEKDLKQNKREKFMRNATDCMKTISIEPEMTNDYITDDNLRELKLRYDNLKEDRRKRMSEIHEIKYKMSEIRSQEDDILRELEMEKALIKGEYDSEIAILNIEQRKKVDLQEQGRKIEEEIKVLKERQESRQNEMRDRVEIATLKVERIERDIKEGTATVEELQNAQDILDNETKIYEDLEFQHLEEESELLANREDIQNDVTLLTKKIEAQKSRILTLKSEANDNLTSALDETKILQAEYVRLLNKVEELTGNVQIIEKELRPIVAKLNDIERTQSPDSAFYTDQTRAKSGEFGYSPQSSDSDDMEISKIANFDEHTKELNDKFNSIDQMSQSMIVDIERRDITDIIDVNQTNSDNKDRFSESPSKSSTSSKEKKGFWERNFDSLSRLKNKDKKAKSPPPPIDIMSQSLNENFFYNNEQIESEGVFDRFNSLRLSKNKKEKKESNGPTKSSSSSKIPTFAALGKIMKKDSFGKKSKENSPKLEEETPQKNRYVKNTKSFTDNKYKSKSLSPDKVGDDAPNQKGHNVTFDSLLQSTINGAQNQNDPHPKILHRKSCGDEPGLKINDFKKISDSGKVPSQDDIDRISKVTIDAPILSSDTDMNSLGRRTLDSLKEIERKRMVMLEEQGCQVIENEREKISELKRRVQDETKKLWDQKLRLNETSQLPNDNDSRFDSYTTVNDSNRFDSFVTANDSKFDSYTSAKTNEDDSVSEHRNSLYGRCGMMEESMYFDDHLNNTGSTIYEDSSGMMSSSIEELQVRNSRTDSLSSRPIEDDKRSDDSRPLSNASDFSRDNILSGSVSSSQAPRRQRAAWPTSSRPLTRYLPVDKDEFDLRKHIETAGHQVELCPHVSINATSCRGYLHKLGAKFHTWSKRWFVFDRDTKTFVYYWDKSEKKPRGGAYFQVIEEVYLDHANASKSPNPQTTFIVKTRQRRYYLMSPSGAAARMWIDVIFTGAQGYTEYLQ